MNLDGSLTRAEDVQVHGGKSDEAFGLHVEDANRMRLDEGRRY